MFYLVVRSYPRFVFSGKVVCLVFSLRRDIPITIRGAVITIPIKTSVSAVRPIPTEIGN